MCSNFSYNSVVNLSWYVVSSGLMVCCFSVAAYRRNCQLLISFMKHGLFSISAQSSMTHCYYFKLVYYYVECSHPCSRQCYRLHCK